MATFAWGIRRERGHRSKWGKFQIHPTTGVLNVSDSLNREEQSSYMLIIEAWDNYQFGYTNGESRNAFKQIGVNIVDVNDESPVFEPINGCVTITEFHELREVVTVVRATDADDPNTPNGRILFSIVSGNKLGLFKLENLDYSSARIDAVHSLKGLYGNYTLVVQAQDLGSPPNVVSTENATLGSTIIQVHATDDDIGLNGAVRYRLKQDLMGNWRTFSVDSESGIILLKQPLDREKQKIYEIRVEAYDLGIPTPLSSDLDLTVYVRNINDYEPQFLVDEMVIKFTEHMPTGMERRKIVDTVDRDEVDELDDPPTPVCYFIVGGNEGDFFTIEPLRHEVMVAKELDREASKQHLILIKATEDCIHSPANQNFFDPTDDTYLKVIVEVEDINDNAPHFVKKVFTGGVTTEADFGKEFMQIKAIDIDEGDNAEVSYYQVGQIQMTLTEGLENVQTPPFLVDQFTGVVQLNFDPQKGMKGYFDFMKVKGVDVSLEGAESLNQELLALKEDNLLLHQITLQIQAGVSNEVVQIPEMVDERIQEAQVIPERERIRLAGTTFQGAACQWWKVDQDDPEPMSMDTGQLPYRVQELLVLGRRELVQSFREDLRSLDQLEALIAEH
uniref:Cadherin domain-containing protein n=1 Tax=Timema shepardi TaxID=629360 RepID=A0A7R9ARS8_TIMSH|nr:unnamed protein product [Timema shepardi]